MTLNRRMFTEDRFKKTDLYVSVLYTPSVSVLLVFSQISDEFYCLVYKENTIKPILLHILLS